MTTATVTASKAAVRADVFHSWTSGSEAAAAGVIAQAYNASGGNWHGHAVAGFENEAAVALNRIVGGDPPDAMAYVPGASLVDLVQQDILESLGSIPALRDANHAIAPIALDSLSVDGEIYGVPIGINLVSGLYYSKSAFEKSGIEGPPASLDELFVDLEKLKKAGFIALAWGGQTWQEGEVFSGFLLSNLGADAFDKFMKGDVVTIRSAQVRHAIEQYGQLRRYVDPDASNRSWNEATNLILQGRAGVQIMGDWVKGEFHNAGFKLDRDFGCEPLPAGGYGIVIVDALVFPKKVGRAADRARKLLVQTILDPNVQENYSLEKGSMPARIDADVSRLDSCSQHNFEMIRNNHVVGEPVMQLTPEIDGAYGDLIGQYWSTPIMTVSQVVDKLVQILHAAPETQQ